ncbi:uncharacterized protein LOC143208719 [Lasioglossum baleicum]|uniref:uncharacterized protein LOC143208719 n=1 Tax=Lasioglossum baleicum TaxID=434251 RepID=UPI003FCCB17A
MRGGAEQRRWFLVGRMRRGYITRSAFQLYAPDYQEQDRRFLFPPQANERVPVLTDDDDGPSRPGVLARSTGEKKTSDYEPSTATGEHVIYGINGEHCYDSPHDSVKPPATLPERT